MPAPWGTQAAGPVTVRRGGAGDRMPQALERADGSWAWVVLLAALVTQGLTLGFPSCIGVFFTDLQRDFQASNSETSWFPSILVAMLHAGGPLCGILVEHFGCRVTMMLGGVLASLGMVASSFSRTLSQLYVTAGFITGLLLDASNNFSYVFYLSSFFLISAALFMGGSFYVLRKTEQGRQAKAEGAIREAALPQALSPKGKETSEKHM